MQSSFHMKKDGWKGMNVLQKRPISAEDLYQMKFAGNPVLSPDGKSVVYVLTEISEEKNGYYSSLYLGGIHKEPVRLTPPHYRDPLIRDTHPKWSPDGHAVAFLSNRSDKTQIWLLPMDGGEARQITRCKESVRDFNWSPDGTRIVFTTTEKDSAEEDNEDVTVVTRLRYRENGVGFLDGYSQVGIVDLETGKCEQITSGPYNHHSPSFAPSGDKIMYLAAKKDDRELVNIDQLYVFDLTRKTENTLYEGKGPIVDPVFSPDGQYVAFAGHEEGENSRGSLANATIWTVSTEDGKVRNVSAAFDRFVGNYISTDAVYDTGGHLLQWTEDSQSVLFLVTNGGDCVLKRVDLEGNVTDAIAQPNSVMTSFDYVNGVFAFVRGDQRSPGNVYIQTDQETIQISRHNEKWLSRIQLSMPENFKFRSADDWEIEGWFLPPVERKPGDKVPVVLEIHGGPHAAYGNAFSHEFQLLAASGYAVVYTNPRGSQGYGRTFLKGCIGDWGGKDREDLMRGLDYALEHYAYCDPDRLYVTGGSYGGQMTNMIVTRTDRFRAAVTQRSSSNLYSFFGTSDMAFYFLPAQLGVQDLWEDEETLLRFSPIRYARNVKTPMCILHSEEDYHVPIEQAEQWFTALTRLGVEARFVRFKGENHGLSRNGKPRNRIRRLQEIVNWFNQHR